MIAARLDGGCLPISNQVCSFAWASFCTDAGTTDPLPLATAGEAAARDAGGGGAALTARGVFGIELPFKWGGGAWDSGWGGGGREWAWA